LRRDHLFERLPGRLRSPPGDDRSVDSVPSRGSSHDPCPHRALLPPPLAELHTPLIVAPALLKPGIVKALALLSSSRWSIGRAAAPDRKGTASLTSSPSIGNRSPDAAA